MKRIAFLSFALVAPLTAGCSSDKVTDLGQAKGSEPAAVGTSVPADVAKQDAKDFIHHVAIVNMAEIDLGKLAADRATTHGVKKFAKMMIADHIASGDKLNALASDLKIDVSGELDDKQIDQRNKLAKRSGADFDREYASAMVDGHTDLIDQLEPRIDKKTLDQWKVLMRGKAMAAGGTVALLPDRSDNPTTTRINQFAADIYPTVYAHLESAKALESSLKKRDTSRSDGQEPQERARLFFPSTTLPPRTLTPLLQRTLPARGAPDQLIGG
jgi:predicted outer membrane protein